MANLQVLENWWKRLVLEPAGSSGRSSRFAYGPRVQRKTAPIPWREGRRFLSPGTEGGCPGYSVRSARIRIEATCSPVLVLGTAKVMVAPSPVQMRASEQCPSLQANSITGVPAACQRRGASSCDIGILKMDL